MTVKGNKTAGAVIYTRVSTGEQAEHGTSLESQRDACRQKALALGLPIVAEYEDAGVSGGFLLTRQGMMAAIADIQAGRADTLICANVSRYSRDVEHQQSLLKSVRAAGGHLVFCDVTFEETPSGDLMFGMMGQFAQWERQEIKRRTVGGRQRKAEQGLQPARTCSPLGYHVVTTADVLRGDAHGGADGEIPGRGGGGGVGALPVCRVRRRRHPARPGEATQHRRRPHAPGRQVLAAFRRALHPHQPRLQGRRVLRQDRPRAG